MNMDLIRQLKQGMNTGTVLFGQRQAMSACSKGDARMILVAANCPVNYISDLKNNHPDVAVHQVMMVNRQLGAACAKPFPVSALCIVDPGQSELLTLPQNV
ncbi:MAG: 50S ribosomal protein L30e [Euryarchaeota archaeon]|jgi:large subunit ribosomal protein L30e|nr:50S ribosomal protein L30e [Euryarchaeota archaeon]MBT4392309.1 50S ribosomal protein L30e [Euryarchaeota archaeon]MBT4802711.1 50S ribosomal protein L30e [Euryarchaeota archaeon]MBT5613701.1 50S ribosomal protein L30e [Euryarchaeota archaeon]MBT6683621.1 50S ribosomal protein L30e [Euryarchaeota archaeon]